MIQNLEVYRKEGEFVAWPANYGLWIWGDEVVVVFSQGFRGEEESLHARDKTRPFIGRYADRAGHARIIVPCLVMLVIGGWLLAIADSPPLRKCRGSTP